MKMKSISSRPFKYAGALVLPQTEFSVKSAVDAKVLTVARRAVEVRETAPPPATRSKRTYKRRDMVAEPAAAATGDAQAGVLFDASLRPAAEDDLPREPMMQDRSEYS